MSICSECRGTVRAAECRWIWIQGGPLTACLYVCPDCQEREERL